MKNIKKSIFLTMILISVFDIVRCVPDEKCIGHTRLTKGGGWKKLGHAVGFSCVVYVDQKFNFVLDVDQVSYANIKECVNIRLVDAPNKKMYDFDPLVQSENQEGELIHSKLSVKYRDIKREELEKTLKSTPKGVLSRCIVDDKDLHVGINGDIYIFKDIFFRDGLHVDEERLKATLCVLLSVDREAIDFKLQAQRALDEQRYIKSTDEVVKTREATLITNEVIAFRKCLVGHKDSLHIAVSGIPKACEGHALTLLLSGCDAQVDGMIAGFKKIMKEEPK